MQSFADQSFGRDGAGGAVNPSVRHLAQPPLDGQIGRLPIDDQAFLGWLESGTQKLSRR